ncbi:hypothetical protein [Vreelandella piezotolerans]|uniref:hypothetical protein n=1 Tax=Vreelandella piezotolerans TaxID=2609667 RepID=UPI0037AAD9E7
MQELFLNLISRFFNRQRSLDELCDALEKYQENKGSPARQLRLEAAFFKAYKKRASAKFIDRLARCDWGPHEAFSVFGRTSPVFRCDFDTHNLTHGRWINFSRTKRALISLVIGLPATLIGAATMTFGAFLLFNAFLKVYTTGGTALLEGDVGQILNVFLVAVLGIAATVLGGYFAYSAWDLITALDKEDKAQKLYEMLNSDS